MSPLEERVAFQLIYSTHDLEPGRFTTSLPITAEVWLAYWRHGFSSPLELLLTPHTDSGAGTLCRAVSELLPVLRNRSSADQTVDADEVVYVAASESHVLLNARFFDLLLLLPLTSWWENCIALPLSAPSTKAVSSASSIALAFRDPRFIGWLAGAIVDRIQDETSLTSFREIGRRAIGLDLFGPLTKAEQWALERLVNLAALHGALTQLDEQRASLISLEEARADLQVHSANALGLLSQCLISELRGTFTDVAQGRAAYTPPLWSVAVNRRGSHADYRSRQTIKVDAAIRVFDVGGKGVRWAIIDSGIDARHPAFARPSSLSGPNDFDGQLVSPLRSRVVRTLDFTRFSRLASGRLGKKLLEELLGRFTQAELAARAREIELSIQQGRLLDWARIEPLLEVPHDSAQGAYLPPLDAHGTHVAGILGGYWTRSMYEDLPLAPDGSRQPLPIELAGGDVCGMCPEIELLDLRVFSSNPEDERGDQATDEFSIIAALQYVRYLNQSKDRQYVHGVNLSLSLRHEVRSYACGSTPICLECERLVGNGVVVVAAAGNLGFDSEHAQSHLGGSHRSQSITDPGNAPSVITVGSTHRTDPYRFGVSYFSSVGPTGDGRDKPDLVAPGEKITSMTLDGAIGERDGTSMAAPHVSGVAALLMSRNEELQGRPDRVKEILCRTASDLGRNRWFQGHGLVDALRALQAI